jgi:uncharacterized delta-60 repeat protein
MKTPCTLFIAGFTLALAPLAAQQAGTLDPAFGTAGKVNTIFMTNSRGNAVAVQPDGNLVVGGSADNGFTVFFGLTRYLANGTLDNTFGNNGMTTANIGGVISQVQSIALQPDGRIVATGYTDSGNGASIATARFNANGSADNSFGTNGVVISTPAGSNQEAEAIALQADGKVVIAGFVSTGMTSSEFILERYNTNGSPDNSFGNNGKVLTSFSAGSGHGAHALAIQADGRIVAAGHAIINGQFKFALSRYLTTGVLDNSFGVNGKVISSVGADSSGTAYALTIQPDGRILVAGFSLNNQDRDFALMRYNSNGSPDLTFNATGQVNTPVGASSNDIVSSMALQPDGKVLCGGTSFQGMNWFFAIARYNANGSIDNTFNGNGIVLTNFILGNYNGLHDMALKTDGKIVVVGETANFSTNLGNIALAQYLPDAVATGVEGLPTESGMLGLYPNPATDRLNLEYRLAIDEKLVITIRDALGRMVSTMYKTFQGQAGLNHEELLIPGGLNNGVYFIQLEGAVLGRHSKRFVLAR